MLESWDGTNWTEVADLNTGPVLMEDLQVLKQVHYAYGGNDPPNNRAVH